MPAKRTVKICSICGREFYGSRKRVTCGSEECKLVLQKRRDQSTSQRIRPYTKTSVILISKDLQEGMTVEEIAKLYDRDVEDVRQFVEKIKQKGIVDYVNKRLDKYQRMRSEDLDFARSGSLEIDLRGTNLC